MRRYLLFTVFISGMTTLAAELAASRLIGNVFGTSNIVWASIIGLILIYLTLGYFLGGKWADANPTPAALYRVLAWGAFTLGLVPYIAGPVLKSAATAFEFLQVGILGASFIAVLILFSVPITLLGTISPFAIRLSVDDHLPRRTNLRANLCHLHPWIIYRDVSANTGHHPCDWNKKHISCLQSACCCLSRWRTWENSPADARCSCICGCQSSLQLWRRFQGDRH